MAVQQRRNSKTRKAKRRTHYKLVKPALTRCPNCGEYKLAHMTNEHCDIDKIKDACKFYTCLINNL